MRVAITGANGFIGQHLARRFAGAGWEVTAVVRRDYESNALGELFAGADVVVHAAGATRAPTRDALESSNVGLTALTLAAATRAGRFVFISSQAAAGPAASLDRPVIESDTPAPVEAYGRGKRDAELLVRAASVPWVVLRPAAVYGPHDRDFLALFRLAARGIAIHPGNREQWISIIHVDDVAAAVIHASTGERAVGGTFFLANETPVQWDALYRAVAECAGTRLRVNLEIPAVAVSIGALFGDAAARLTGRAGLLTTEKVALAKAPFWVCSGDHARAVLHSSPFVELQRGLCDTYHWYRQQGWI